MLSDLERTTNHEICLELLDKFVEVCEKNSINYYLSFGSCLGAVRHKGFIPWDINIDVLMTTDEYWKLDDAMKKEELGNMEWCTPEGSARMFPLLRRNDSGQYESDPNIDVSLYSNAPNNSLLRNICRRILYFNIKMYKLKNTHVERTFPFNILKGVSLLIPNKAYEKLVTMMSKINKNKETKYMMILLPSVWDDREHLEKSWIGEKPNYGIFEGRKVRLISNTHDYLSMRYGHNYMTPKVWEDKGTFKHQKTN